MFSLCGDENKKNNRNSQNQLNVNSNDMYTHQTLSFYDFWKKNKNYTPKFLFSSVTRYYKSWLAIKSGLVNIHVKIRKIYDYRSL